MERPSDQAGRADHDAGLSELLDFLKARTGRDFTAYKRATILRRIGRRMHLEGLDDLSDYLRLLRTKESEAGALLQDLLISVTNFFRDPPSFEALERTVPDLFKGKAAGDTVRVWVAGCATGEEAYSIAILLCEHAGTLVDPPQIQVFATDLNEAVVREAREGLYPDSIAADIGEERLQHFFVHEQGGYRVRRSVREIVHFTPHDLLEESPFAWLDLVSCRNLLIYLNREAQSRALDIFHFALRPGGRLFLGTSEALDEGSPLFAVLDKKQRLYVQRPGPKRLPVLPGGPGMLSRALAQQERTLERTKSPRRETSDNVNADFDQAASFDGGLPMSELHYRLIERLSPPSIIVDSAFEIVHISESAGRFLRFTGGEPTRNLLLTVHPMLRAELRAVLYATAESHATTKTSRVPVDDGDARRMVDIRVAPAGDLAPGFLLVVFEEHPWDGVTSAVEPRSYDADRAALFLERELAATKAHLRDTIEESRASNEELKASNEELQAMNEELRSATEELETSREQLQSINLQVTTVNDELKSNMDQLARSNNDLQTLMAATDIATVFLDRDLRIQRVTPAANVLFALTSNDLGRPLSDLGRPLNCQEIVAEVERSLAHLQPAQLEVSAGERLYIARILPYRTATDHVVGVVLTFHDITTRRDSEYALRESEERFRATFEQAAVGIAHLAPDGQWLRVNGKLCDILGFDRDELLSRKFHDITHPDDLAADLGAVERLVAGETTKISMEKLCVRKDGSPVWVDLTVSLVRKADGRPDYFISVVQDSSDRKRIEKDIVRLAADSERQRRLYETVLTNTPDFVYVFSLDYRVIYANDALIKMWGRGHDGAIGKTFLEIGYEPWHAALHEREIDQVRATRQPIRGEVPFHGTHGRRQYDYIFVPVIGADGEVEAVAGTTRDVTERKETEGRQEFLVKLGDTIRLCSNPIAVQAEASRLLGEHLGVNRVVYFEVRGDEYVVERDYTDGAKSIVGHHSMGSFGREMLAAYRAGWTACEADVDALPSRRSEERAAYEAVQIRAYVGVPLVKEGAFVAGLAVHMAKPRLWTATEVAIVEEAAQRTWAAVERVRAEAALHESEERSAFVRRSSGVGFWYCDLPFDVLQWDQLVKAHFHLPADATVTIHTFYDRLHPEDREPTRRAIERSIATRTSYNVDYRTVDPNTGALKWIRAIGRTFYAADGTPTRFDGVTLDVSDQKRAEASLKESEQRFRLVADAAPVLIWLSGTDKLCYWFNQPWLAFTGRSMDQETGYGWSEGVHPDDLDVCLRTYGAAVNARTPFSFDYRLRRHDGEFRWLINNGVPRYGPAGEFEGYIGSCLDVTDYKNAEARLLDADRRKDEFLATLAHELRNPLAPIRSGLQLIRMAGANGTVEEIRSMMDRQLTQLVRLVDDLLDASRMTSGKLQLRREQVELRSLIATAVETIRPAIEEAGHELVIDIPDEPIRVDVDVIRLAQVVSNLLSNSAKYTHRGGHIRLTAWRDGDMVCVSVADDGIGIPPAMLDRVFDMFTQVDRALEKTTGGLGIGLSLVKGLVEMHGGTIEARSEGDGQGSEFVVRLPGMISECENADPHLGVEHVEVSSKHRILIADDNVDAADSLGKLLDLLGNEVVTAYDGLQAVELAKTFQPDVILLDLGMPKLSGYDAARRIRAHEWGRTTMLVALTGWGQDEDRNESSKAGFDHHLVKPLEVAVLMKLLAGSKKAK